MTFPNKRQRSEPAPALYRLLSDSAVSRAALGACALPLVLVDATGGAASVTYCNPAFQRFFSYSESETVGTPLPVLVFRGEAAPLHALLGQPAEALALPAYAKDGSARQVDATLGVVRSAEGLTTHWVIGFADRSELERLRAELAAARALMRTAA